MSNLPIVTRNTHSEITGQKVILRPLTAGYLEIVRRWRNQDRVREQFFSAEVISQEQHREWWAILQTKPNDLCFIIFTQDWRPVGFAALYDINIQERSAEVGRMMIGDKQDLNQGYMTDTLRALINYGDQILGITRVYLWVKETNTAGICCYNKAGFVTKRTEPGKILMEFCGNYRSA